MQGVLWGGSKKIIVFFFFQAEDGIRDYDVTGVQTCALPISKLSRIECRPQLLEEQPAIEPREHMDGQEEVWPAGDPSFAVLVATGWRQPAAGDDTMEVRMMGERLPPCVEDGDEADLGAQMPGIGGNGAQRLGRRSEQHGIDQGLVMEGDGVARQP